MSVESAKHPATVKPLFYFERAKAPGGKEEGEVLGVGRMCRQSKPHATLQQKKQWLNI